MQLLCHQIPFNEARYTMCLRSEIIVSGGIVPGCSMLRAYFRYCTPLCVMQSSQMPVEKQLDSNKFNLSI